MYGREQTKVLFVLHRNYSFDRNSVFWLSSVLDDFQQPFERLYWPVIIFVPRQCNYSRWRSSHIGAKDVDNHKLRFDCSSSVYCLLHQGKIRGQMAPQRTHTRSVYAVFFNEHLLLQLLRIFCRNSQLLRVQMGIERFLFGTVEWRFMVRNLRHRNVAAHGILRPTSIPNCPGEQSNLERA